MVTKTRNAKPLPASDPTTQAGRAALDNPPDITDADREAALAVIERCCCTVIRDALTVAKTVVDVEFELRKYPSIFGRNLPLFPALGEPVLSMDSARGVIVEINGRRGEMSWDEISEAAWAGDLTNEPAAATNGHANGNGKKAATKIPSGGRPRPHGRSAVAVPAGGDGPAAQAEEKPRETKSRDPGIAGIAVDADVRSIMVPVGQVHPSPYQNRRDFDKDELAKLAEDIKANGILQPIVIRARAAGGGYELVCGERRLRAAKLAGLKQVPAGVRVMTDEEAAGAVLAENLFRADLNAIEEAQGYRTLLDTFKQTQKSLAVRFGTSEANISNKLRLLELPELWRKKVTSGEITGTHARALVPYALHFAILEKMEHVLKNRSTKDGPPSVAEWQRELVNVVFEIGMPLSGGFYDEKHGNGVVAFKATPELVERLGVVEISRYMRKHKLALNLELWWELQNAAMAKKAAAAEKREAKGRNKKPSGGGRAGRGGATKKKTPTVDYEKVFKRKLVAWRLDWMLYLLHQAFSEREGIAMTAPTQQMVAATRLLMFLAFSNETRQRDKFPSYSRAQRLFQDRKRVAKGLGNYPADLEGPALAKLGREASAALCYSPKNGPSDFLPANVIEQLAVDLSIDLATAWKHELGGPLTAAFFEMHTKEKLLALGSELGVHLDGTKPKSTLVKLLAGSINTKKKLPKEIAPVKKVK